MMTNGGEYTRDVVKSIKNNKLIDMDQEKPSLRMSTLDNPRQKANQERQFKMDYQIERTTHEKKVNHFEMNLQWARAAIIQKHVSNKMLEKLRNEEDYKSNLEYQIGLLKEYHRLWTEVATDNILYGNAGKRKASCLQSGKAKWRVFMIMTSDSNGSLKLLNKI